MGDNKKKDNRSFCFCMHAQVDCLPGVVLDCNNHKRKVCPLVEEVLAVNKDKEKQVKELKEKFKKKDAKPETAKTEEKKAESKKEEKKKDNRSFCFLMHAQVDCSPGVVLDCNNHKRKVCPLVEEVLSVNKDKELQVSQLKEKFKKKDKKSDSKQDAQSSEKKPVDAEPKSKKDENKAETKKEAPKKKDNRAFCFCLGAQVECLPGVVLDCNNHKRTVCPILLEALPYNEEQKEKVKEIIVLSKRNKE